LREKKADLSETGQNTPYVLTTGVEWEKSCCSCGYCASGRDAFCM